MKYKKVKVFEFDILKFIIVKHVSIKYDQNSNVATCEVK